MNPKQALEAAAKYDFACVLMNAHLGHSKSFELMAQFKQINGHKHTPFVFITAEKVNSAPIIDAYQQGVADFLFMPIMAEVLISKINVFISLYQKNAQLIQEISRRKAVEKELVKMARFDALTGLSNRYMFTDQLNQAVHSAQRTKTPVAVLFIDLDHFKTVNDTYGHDVGDALLKSVSQRLQQSVRASDLVARLGGDEFAVIAQGFDNSQNLATLADKIIQTLTPVHQLNGHNIHATLSIGIAIHDISTRQPAEQLLKQADVAMYQAKEAGRNGFRFFAAQ